MKIDFKKLCFVALILSLLCIGIASAQTYTFPLTYSNTMNTNSVTSGSSGSGPQYSYYTNLNVNFDALTNPTLFQFYNVFGGNCYSGTFVITYGSYTIATGTYQFQNGTFSTLYSMQETLNFSSWNKNGLTGVKLCTVSFSSGTPALGNYINSVTVSSPFSIAVGPYSGFSSSVYGYYFTADTAYSSNNVYLDDNNGSSVVTMSVDKLAYNSRISVFSSTAKVYQELTINNNNIRNMTVGPYKPIIVQMYSLGQYINSTLCFTPQNYYTASWSPTNPAVNQTITLTISNASGAMSDYSVLKFIQLSDNTPNANWPQQVYSSLGLSGGYTLDKLSNGQWQYDNGSAMVNFTLSSLPTFTLRNAGTHNLVLTLQDNNGQAYYANLDITTVTTTTNLNLIFIPYDQISGASISGAEYDVYDTPNSQWVNQTELGLSHAFGVRYGYYYPYVIKASNYVNTASTFGVNSFSGVLATQTGNINLLVQMYPTNAASVIGANNASLNVEVYNTNTISLVGASVTVKSLTTGVSYSQTNTVGLGYASFIVPQNATYQVTASFTGYASGTKQVVITTVSPVTVRIYLATPIITAITTTTTSPTPTPNLGIGNNTAGTSGMYGNGTCILYPPEDASFMDKLKNMAACNGVKSESAQNILIGTGIIIIAALIGGKAAKGIGAIIGACITYVSCLALGLMPIWTLITFFVIAGVLFAVKMWRSGED